MNTLYRYPLEVADQQSITAPGLHRVVSVEDRRGQPEVWVEVATGNPLYSVTVWVVGTGNPIPEAVIIEGGYYVGHFLAAGGSFVGHVYASSIRRDRTEVDHATPGSS